MISFFNCQYRQYLAITKREENERLSFASQVQDAFRCRLRNCQDPINADSSSSFPNGHAQIMVSFYFPSEFWFNHDFSRE